MSYRNEVYRKLIHIASTGIPLAYLFFFERDIMLWVLGLASAAIVLGEVLRMRIPFFTRLYRLIFGAVVREKEDHTPTGATFTLWGSFLTILIFEKYVAVFALLVLSLADSTAALIGKKWGRRLILEKTVEGTLTFLIVSTALAMTLPGIPRIGAVFGAFVATAVELLPSPLNDNIMVPLAAAMSLSVVNLLS